jgi:HAE1 family hydrophobic/amphiphilic exporter-1
MLFFFLKDRRLPFVIGIAIPTSVMLTFFIMYLFDIQISIISLSGLTLGVGLLVDNAIIVIENISKHYKNGLSLIQLAGEGTKEIALPVTASTLTTISVFLPLLFLGGFEGVFFRDQAFTLSVSLLASLFVALVLIPGIVVGIKKEGTSISQNEHFDDSPRPKWLYNLYEKVLVWLLKKRWPAAIIFLLGLAIMFVSFGKIPKEIIPEVPPDRVGITFTLPANSSLQTAEFAAIHLQQELAALGFTEGVLLLGGFTDQASIQKLANQQVNRFTLSMPTPNASKRKTIQQWMNKMVLEQPEWHIDLEVSETDLRNILNYDEAPLMITWVNEERQDFMPWLKVYQLFLKENNISIVFKPLYNRTEKTLLIRPNESKMLDYGVSVRDFEAVLSASSDGLRTGTWFHEDEEQPIRLFQLNKNEQDLPVIRKNGAILPLSLFAVVDTVSQPEVLERRGQTPVWRLTSEILLSDAWSKVEKINQLNREFSRRSGIELQTGGIVTQLAVFLREMQWLLILSVGLIYIILAIQYESLIYPGIILISVPFAWLGAVLMLLVFNVSLNVFSFLGILILTGIAVNDAILKVDFMKRYVEQFGNPQKGILLAGKNRFRPVLMTTATTVIGLIPLIIPIGEGLAYRQSLGLTLIGGMVTSTFLTLLIIPILFDSLHALKKQMSTPKKIKTSDAKH